MDALRQLPRAGGRALVALVALLLLVAIVITFSGTLTRSTDVATQADQARVKVADAQERLAESEKELAFVETDAFIEWQARGYGFGEAGERAFKLRPDAPPPEPITPIGPQGIIAEPRAPFDAWMDLLFGVEEDASPSEDAARQDRSATY